MRVGNSTESGKHGAKVESGKHGGERKKKGDCEVSARGRDRYARRVADKAVSCKAVEKCDWQRQCHTAQILSVGAGRVDAKVACCVLCTGSEVIASEQAGDWALGTGQHAQRRSSTK